MSETNPTSAPDPDAPGPHAADARADLPGGGTRHASQHQHPEDPEGGATLLALRITAALTALGGLVQGVLGVMAALGSSVPLTIHSTVGLVTMIIAIIAGVASALWSRKGGNTGLMMHALTVAVLGVLQYGLGKMGLRTVHMAIGLVFVIAAVALATLAYRKPYAANPHGSLNESTHTHES